jgi:Flp pilus assembly pilin Flp
MAYSSWTMMTRGQVQRDIGQQLAQDEAGAALVEYRTLIGLITAALVVIVLAIGGKITNRWQIYSTTLNVMASPVQTTTAPSSPTSPGSSGSTPGRST